MGIIHIYGNEGYAAICFDHYHHLARRVMVFCLLRSRKSPCKWVVFYFYSSLYIGDMRRGAKIHWYQKQGVAHACCHRSGI